MEVEERSQPQSDEVHERTDIVILVTAKRMKLTFEELNEFTMQDYMDFANMWVGKKKSHKATQADIDKMLA